MKTVLFKGEDKYEVDKKILYWSLANPSATLLVPPVEICLPMLKTRKPDASNESPSPDLIFVRFEYRD